MQSVDRAIGLLEALSKSGSGASLSELASTVKLNVSTCHHLLATLAKWGYVAKVPGTRGYALGARVLQLSQAYLSQIDLPRRAAPMLERLGQATGETVYLAVLQGDAVVIVAKHEARHAVRVETAAIGASEPAHATATGKAMLAWLPDAQMARVLGPLARGGGAMAAFTPNTITGRDDLVEQLRHVRRNGFALDREEYQPGVVCVGAAVRDHAGAVIGALGVAAPHFRTEAGGLDRIREAVITAASDLSAEIGAPSATVSTTDQQ